MEAAPPSYETATLTNPWFVIAPYIQPSDYPSACLVCHSWHSIFAARLWANPTAVLGHHEEHQGQGLDRFLDKLSEVRPSVRTLAHTIDISRAGTPNELGDHDSDWLERILSHLPNLQSLIVDSAPHFDHSALVRLSPALSVNLRLLDVSHCQNATALGLATLLRQAQALVYLDLSQTTCARTEVLLRALSYMTALRVLKMARAGLGDDDIKLLADSIRKRVRSLDLRHNNITMRGIDTLRQACASEPDSLSIHGVPVVETSTEFEFELKRILVNGYGGRLSIEEPTEAGITHLYISRKAFGKQGLVFVLRHWPLFVLDCGHDPQVSREQRSMRDEKSGGIYDVSARDDGLTGAGLAQTIFALTFLRASYEHMFFPLPILEHEMPNAEVIDHGQGSHTSIQYNNKVSYHDRKGLQMPVQGDHDHGRGFFRPSSFPLLRQLVICDMPARSATQEASNNILSLITACADSARQAHDEAKQDWTRPPQRGSEPSASTFARAVKGRFALETIVLELQTPKLSTRLPAPHSVSITCDRDSDAMWAEARADFSFFESGFSQNAAAGVAGDVSCHEAPKAESPHIKHEALLFDNIALIAARRAMVKAEYQRLCAAGEQDPHVEHYWPGVIKVVRPH